jgi:hypothetical protein
MKAAADERGKCVLLQSRGKLAVDAARPFWLKLTLKTEMDLDRR